MDIFSNKPDLFLIPRNGMKAFEAIDNIRKPLGIPTTPEAFGWLVNQLYSIRQDGCNFIVTTPSITFTVRNPSCSEPIVTPPPIQQEGAPYVPPPQSGSSGIYLFYSKGKQRQYEVSNRGAYYIDAKRTWSYSFIEAKFPESYEPNFSNRGKFTFARDNYLHIKTTDQPVSIADVKKEPITLNFFRVSNSYNGLFNESNTAALANITTIAAGFNYEQAIEFANSEIGKNRYFYEYRDRGNGDFLELEMQIVWECVEIESHYFYPPPPPEYKQCKEGEDCMCCEKNDALLRLLLKRVGNLPASVPDNIAKRKPSQINIDSLAELMLWQIKQYDAVMGNYPIDIEIEDTDATKEGNQSQKITIPNMAEGMAEIFGLLHIIQRDGYATMITCIKSLIEAGANKQMLLKVLDLELANAEYLGYKLEQKRIKLPLTFSPGETSMDKFLQEKEVDVVTYENTEKDDLQDDLKILKTMAARWNAQNWRSVRGDTAKEMGIALREMLLKNPGAIEKEYDKTQEGDFGDFLEETEKGFTGIDGITDNINPFGRPLSQRPRIREIGIVKDKKKK